jgi:hypothetical protein
MNTNKLAKLIIDGPINTTTYYIFNYIQQGKLDAAIVEYQRDGDKVSKYYKDAIEELIGCRVHGIIDCTNVFCKRKFP